MIPAFLALILALSTPCATEDDTLCHWDAATRGNGIGNSFISLDIPGWPA